MTANEKKVKITMIVVVSCVIFAVLMLASLIISLVNLASVSSRKKALEANLLALNQMIEANDRSIAYYQTDEYIDRIAREYLNMQGKDEISFIGK